MFGGPDPAAVVFHGESGTNPEVDAIRAIGAIEEIRAIRAIRAIGERQKNVGVLSKPASPLIIEQ
jgi:hypothetical protein